MDASENQTKAAEQKAHEVYNMVIKKPDSFAELANKFTQSSTAPNGGDLGFQPPQRLAPEFFEAIKGKKEGYISPPVQTQFGLHIIKVLAVKPEKEINKELYKKIIYDIRRDEAMSNYFKGLKAKAAIQINKNNL